MSTQNNLKKPVFTKSMLGYTTKEVDQYIEYVNERYNALSRDVSELKRRVTRLQLGLESPNNSEEATTSASTDTGFTDAAIDRLRGMIEAERLRHEEALSALLNFIESHSHGEELPEKVTEDNLMTENEFVPLLDDADIDSMIISEDDAEWKEALESFIADAAESDDEQAEAEAEAEVLTETEAEVSEISEVSEVAETSEVAEVNEEAKAISEKKKTPAELAAELDFYSDNVVRDGESYDPMTLAQSATMKRRRPTLEDFMNPIYDGDEPKKK